MGRSRDTCNQLLVFGLCYGHACLPKRRVSIVVSSMFMILTFDHNIARAGISICTTSMFYFITASLVLRVYGFLSDLTYPRCTNSLVDKAESDCGSTAWAFGLFIAWNLLSMVSSFLLLKEIKLLTLPLVYFRKHVHRCCSGKLLLCFSSFWEWI